jgi:hypothetical protein
VLGFERRRESEVLIEDSAELMVDGEGLTAAAGPMKRLHESDVERLVQGVRDDQSAQLTDDFAVLVVG